MTGFDGGYGELVSLTFNSVAVTKLLSVEPQAEERDAVDLSVLGDTAQSFRPGTLAKAGSINVTCEYSASAHEAIHTDFTSGTVASCVLVINSSTDTPAKTYTWAGAFVKSWHVSNFKQSTEVQCEFTIQLSGACTVS